MALAHCVMKQCLIASLVPVLSLISMVRATCNDYSYKCINKNKGMECFTEGCL